MSHHFTAEFTVPAPGKDPVSKKLQRDKSLAVKKRENDQLEFDNKQMEWKLSQIKKTMAKEKEDRGKQDYIWKSGKTGNLDSYARNILGRTISATSNGTFAGRKNSPKGIKSNQTSKTQVKVLKDKPIDLPKRDSATKDLVQKLKSGFQVDSIDTNTKSGVSNSVVQDCEQWILVSTDRSSNDIMEIQSDANGNLLLSSICALEPTAVGVYFLKWGRKRLMMAVDNVIRKPKGGWGNEIYYPYAGRFLPEMTLKPEPPLLNSTKRALSTTPEPPPVKNGGLLLKGDIDEEKNTELFQQAVNEWRKTRHDNKVPTSLSKKTPDVSVHVVQCNPPEIEIKFSETSTLSYMERVLLEKHRHSMVPSMPGSNFVEQDENSLNSDCSEENVFSVEELEERERIRDMFTPQLISLEEIDKDSRSEDNLNKDLLIQEVSDDECSSSSQSCVIEESPPSSPTLQKVTSSIVIEEVDYAGGLKPHLTYLELSDTSNSSPPIRNQPMAKQEQVRYRTKSAKSFPCASQSPSAVSRSKSADIKSKEHPLARKASSLVKAIAKIPHNPDAIYCRGLNDFFVPQNYTTVNGVKSTPQYDSSLSITSSNIATESTLWNRSASLFLPGMAGDGDTINAHLNNSVNNAVSSPMPWDYDLSHEKEEKELAERVLDDLEWELASRTGNITADGRISRIIDEWPEEELDIIEDQGLGSGLSTPDVDCVSLASTYATNTCKNQMNLDFQSMEQLIMADLTDEYSEEDDELLVSSR